MMMTYVCMTMGATVAESPAKGLLVSIQLPPCCRVFGLFQASPIAYWVCN